MMVLKKISMLIIAASMFCGEGVFARSHSRHDDQDTKRASRQLRKAISEQKKADRNAAKKRQKRIKAENNYKRKVAKNHRSSAGKTIPLPPQDAWTRIDRSNGMSEITRIRYRNVIYKGKIVDAPVGYSQAPVIVPTPLADTTLAYLKVNAAQEPRLAPLVLRGKRR